MSLECMYKDVNVCHREFFNSADCTCDTNLIVPDTKGDIVKILSLKTSTTISDTKVEKDRLIVSGQVKFNLLYIGEDAQNKVSTLCTITPFSHTISITTTENSIPLVNICANASSYTLINSRKVRVSANLKLSGVIYHTKRIKALSSAPSAETKTKEITTSFPTVICKKTVSITDCVELPGNNSEIQSVLKSSAKVTEFDYKILNNKAILKGNVLMTVLYIANEDMVISSVTIPFTEVVEAEGLAPLQEVKINISVADCSAIADTDLSGEYKMLEVSILLTAAITAFNKDTLSFVSDIFLPKGNIKTESCSFPIESLSEAVCEEEFVKETITLQTPNNPFGKIIEVDTDIVDISVKDNLLTGILSVCVLYQSPDSSAVNSITEKITVTHKLPHNHIKNIKCRINHTGYAITSDTSMELRLSLCFEGDSFTKEDATFFTLCEETDFTPPSRPSVIVSFVNKGDSLWSIAKRHNIPLSKLSKANDLDENSVLTIGEKLIIPR